MKKGEKLLDKCEQGLRICLRKKENKPGPQCVNNLAAGDLAAKGGRAADEVAVADGINIIRVR